MKTIDTKEFKYTLKDIHKNTDNRKFCFVIGSGASIEAGIPSGGELATKWFAEIRERCNQAQFDIWLNDKQINGEDLGASYGNIYRKRFENDKISGYESLVQAMKSAKPSFGHIVLSQILTRASGHCVLTTNFDNLIESSVYQFTDRTPLVCGHESLSGYARPSQIHPLIIKLHRDLLLAPQNDPDEINKLHDSWNEPLDHIFSTHIPIVIGYGGNDGSLMTYFEKMNKPSNFFWCGLSETLLSSRIKKLIDRHDGSFVDIDSFDDLMFELLWVFDEIKPINEVLNDVLDQRIIIAKEQFEKIREKHELPDSEVSAFEYNDLAEKEVDFEKRKQIYQIAIKKFPDTPWLWWRFTHFLHFLKEDYIDLDLYYKRAIELNNNEPGLLVNYALFLQDVLKDNVKAEEYFNKALFINSSFFLAITHYANFLYRVKKDYKKAEYYYLLGLSLNPIDGNINNNYAIFLRHIKKDYIKSQEYHLKALEIDSKSDVFNMCYAVLHHHGFKDKDKAEKYYLKALEINPSNNVINGNLSQLMFEKRRNEDAIKYMDKSFIDIKNDDLLVELWFYRYAHIPQFYREAEEKIEGLLSKGVKSISWSFDGNISIAKEDNHPNIEKLKDFAVKITAD